MKILVAAALLFALVLPAEAKARDLSDLRKWQDLDFRCHDAPVADDEELDVEITQKDYDKTRRGQVCSTAKALEKKLTPYQEGMRDYREGRCYRARPYTDHGPEQKLWERGYDAGAKKYPKRDMSHCHLG